MAPFNPELGPTEPKNYLNWSSPVSGGVPNQSRGIALKTIGEGVADVAGVADKFVKTQAENQTRDAFEALRETHLQNLQAVTQPQPLVPQPAATPAGKVAGDPSLLDANASADVPDSIQRGMARIATLSAAAEGKANDTPYTAAQYSLLKRMRSEYPNYRQWIDATASSVTGKDPANAYAENMLQDLNQQRAATKNEVDKTLSEIRKYAGYKTIDGIQMNQMYQFVQTHGTAAIGVANQWIDQVAKTEVDARLKTAAVTAAGQDKASRKEKAEDGFSTLSTNLVNNNFYSNAAQSDLLSSGKIAERIAEEGLYPGTYSSTDMETAGRMIVARRATMEAKLQAESTRLIIDPTTNAPAVDANGNNYSYFSLNGPTKTAEIINAALKPYDISSKAALDEKTGTASYAASHAQRFREDLDNKFVTDPTNIALVKLGILQKNVGPQMTDTVYKQLLSNDADHTALNWLTDKTVNMMIGPNNQIGLAQPTFKKDVEDAMSGKAQTGKPLAPETKVYDRLAENIYKMLDPELDDKTKMNIAKYYFSPEGRGVLGSFAEGYRKPNGDWVSGREAVWDTLTSPKVTDEVARLSRLPGGGIIAKNYKDWMEQEFAQYMFQPQLQILNKPTQYTTPEKGIGLANPRTLTDKVHFDYVNEDGNPKFIMVDKNHKPIDPEFTGGAVKVPRQPGETVDLYRFKNSIDKLNAGLTNMVQMEKSLGGDVNAYLWDTLVNKFNIHPDADVKGLPEKMAEAIKNSSKPAMKIQDVLTK